MLLPVYSRVCNGLSQMDGVAQMKPLAGIYIPGSISIIIRYCAEIFKTQRMPRR